MKLLHVVMLFSGVLGCVACAQEPLQRIVAQRREQTITQNYADKPLVYGAADRIGTYSAEASRQPLTLTDVAPDAAR